MSERGSKQTYRYPTAGVVVTECAHRIAVGRVRGLVTLAAAGQIMQDEHRWLGGTQLAQIIDCSRAGIALGPNELLATAQAELGNGVPPTVFVVGADQLPLFKEYADLAMAAGVIKAAVSSMEQAQAWAASKAPVYAWRQERDRRLESGVTDSSTANLGGRLLGVSHWAGHQMPARGQARRAIERAQCQVGGLAFLRRG